MGITATNWYFLDEYLNKKINIEKNKDFVTKYDDTTIPHKPYKYPLAFYDDFIVFRTKWDEE